ncbi:MAG: hypothetical protein DMF64_01865 [Acidobacteria bacterium]|nr:MAG: hypothetical protein DMF64_01865 [Acidobacteriota bacterium]
MLRRYALAWAFVLVVPAWVAAQSPDLNLPTPVGTNEIEGRIVPRDLGDSRLTSHFYTFNGTQGDLVLTIESNNLDGAIDLFLTNGLRPLTQITLYGGIGALNVTKSVFLRKEEALVLRVQARTPNDTDGTYRIRLGGTFQPVANVAANTPAQTENAAANRPPARSSGRNLHRVNAVGARIEEPEPKAETNEKEAKTETPASDSSTTPRATTTRTRPTRRGRPAARTTTARKPTPAPVESNKTETTKTETAETSAPTESTSTPTETATAAPTPAKPAPTRNTRTARRRNARTPRTGQTAQRTNEPANETTPAPANGGAVAAPQIGATRLVIEIKDGTKVEHDMNEVGRVTVVNQLIVVVLKNGRIERYPLTNVLRMAIEP